MNSTLLSRPIRSVSALNLLELNPLNRATAFASPTTNTTTNTSQKVLLCHDMAGGYGKDALIQGCNDSKQYSFQFWQFISIFCYFSHDRITIPPAVWSNAAHRNGSQCLGTFIVEWQEGTEEILRLIYGPTYNRSNERSQRVFDPYYADRLVDLAVFYRFDGYLVNVESPLPSAHHCNVLRDFLIYLTAKTHERIPAGLIIWYDSVIETGELRWQDQVNEKNEMFFKATDAIFVNYTWNAERLVQSGVNAGERRQDVFTGIDVWGRNTFGGGGYNCHKALRKISETKTSVALFGQAWTFEKLGPDEFAHNERRMWIDSSLMLKFSPGEMVALEVGIDKDDFGCCADYLSPLSIEGLFYSSFDMGFGEQMFIDGVLVSSTPWHHLSRQSISPSYQPFIFQSALIGVGRNLRASGSVINIRAAIDHSKPYDGGSCLAIKGKRVTKNQVQYLSLFKTFIDPKKIVQFMIRIVYHTVSGVRLGIVTNMTSSGPGSHPPKQSTVISFPTQYALTDGWSMIDIVCGSTMKATLGDVGLALSGDRSLAGSFTLSAGPTSLPTSPSAPSITHDFDVFIGSISLIPVIEPLIQHLYFFTTCLKDGSTLLDWEDAERDFCDLEARLVFAGMKFMGTSYSSSYLVQPGIDVRHVQVEVRDKWNRTVARLTGK